MPAYTGLQPNVFPLTSRRWRDALMSQDPSQGALTLVVIYYFAPASSSLQWALSFTVEYSHFANFEYEKAMDLRFSLH